MQISFDQFGNLSPSQKSVFTLPLLKTIFVDEFQESKTRKIIFEGLEAFLTNLSNFIDASFDLWVDGSFVTNKLNPNDIDVVLIIDAFILAQKGKEIEILFKSNTAKLEYLVDAYTIAKYDELDSKYPLFQIEKAYWANWFGYSRRNIQGKRFPKGFLEIKFERNENRGR
jgi:hypothetical protein